MSVPFKNVTVTVTPIGQTQLSDQTLDNPQLLFPAAGIQGFLDMLTPQELYREYAVELRNPALLSVDPGAYPDIPQGAQVDVISDTGWGGFVGMKFHVHGRGDLRSEGLQLDHITYIVDRLTVPVGGGYLASNP